MQANEIKSTIQVLKNERKQLEDQIASIDQIISNLENRIGYLKGTEFVRTTPFQRVETDSEDEKDFPIYDKNWPYSKKILYILKEKQRFLHFREIAEEIARIEGISNPNIKELAGKLSSSSFNIKKKKQIVKVSLDKLNRKTFWGSPKWLDKDGNIRPEHMYNEELAKKNSSADEIEL